MTHACPNALSLAVVVAISSSIVGTQVLADRRLQIKSVDIMGYSHMKFTRSEVMVKPTLGDDQQPIPKSFTTTYPDQSRVKADYVTAAESFTDTLSETDVDVSSVDLFETGEDDVAQKYTKILKVGNEGIFKFTHNLEETELVIEVRGGMTDQASVDAVRTHWSNMLSLEPFTKIARPTQLFAVLDGAEERTGNLGNSDHYIALATIEVEKVEVNGRTFMRLISGGDQPPELKRLSQSLFVNDEALLAAATSAYIQLHVQGENLQQKALNELLAHNKPVGYVVHVEDNTEAHPVPAGYPKLEVTEASGEIIVFHGQKQNPADVAFVQNLYGLVKTDPGNHATTRINIGKVKDYQYVIRCRQMAILEELAADHKLHNTEIDKCQLSMLTYYESLQQVLTSAIADVTPGFEFTAKHIRVAASVITSTWLQFQLRKHFGFKPVLKNFLSCPLFVQNIQTFIPVINIISKSQIDAWGGDERFASKVIRDMTRQLPEMYYRLEELKVKEARILRIKHQFQDSTDTEVDNEKEKLEAQQIRQGIEDELAKLRVEMESLEIQEQKLQQESKRIPALERPLHHARNVHNSRLARELGIADWDDTLPQEEQARRITERINEILMATVATEQHQLKTVTTNLAAIEGQLGIIPDNKNDLDARFQLIQQHLKQQATRIDQKYLQQQVVMTETEKTSVTKAQFATIAAHLNIQDFDDKADIETQKALLIQRLQTQNTQGGKLNVHQERILQKIQELNAQSGLGKTDDILMQNALLTVFYGVKLPEDSTVEDRIALLDTIHKNVLENEQKLASLEEELEDIRTPGHPRAKPEVLGKLSAVEEALKMDDLDLEDDEYYRHHEISREMQISITDARQQAEEEAQNILKTVEEMLRIEVNEWDDNEKRLDRVLIKLDDDDVTKKMLDDIHHALWKDDLEPGDKTDKVWKLRKRLTFYATYTDLRASEQQTELLDAVEYELGIDRSKNVAAKERGKHLVAKLADDLNIEFEIDASLNEQKALLEYRFRELNYEVGKPYDDEGIRRGINNEIASHLGIQGYKEDAPARDQICLIKETLGQRYRAALEAFHPRVDDRIAVINAELDRQMARLGSKPRYVLDREQARARRYIEKAESELEQLHRRLNAVHSEQVIVAHSNDAPPDTDKYITALNQAMKQIQTELGLPHAENQNSEDRLNDIERFLQRNEDDAERQVEIIRKLRAAIKDLKIPFENAPDNLLAEDCIDAIRDFTASHSRDEVDHAMGELPETRKKYAQVTKFLREHDFVEMELTNAQTEEKQAQEALDTKNQDIDNSKDNDPKAETTPEQTREVPDLVLKQKKAKVSEVQKAVDDHEADLKAIEDDIGLKPDPTDRIADRLDALKNKQVQLGGDDGAGGKILQLTREKDRLIKKVDAKKAAIETLKEVLKATEEAVEKDGGPFQYHPRQANILVDIYAFVRTHSLKKQALEAAMGLAESAEKSGKVRPDLPTFDFDDEFAPIRLRALVGDDLTFNQARRIVEVFKNLKTTFMFQPIEDQSLNTLEEVQDLADWARTHIKTGPQHYDDEIHGMGEAAIHYVEHEPEDLKSFSEYFATRSASGNRIIALLHEGLISKVELEHYIKTVRGVDGYQTVDEFEHFLG
ncbi:hypothetical protein, partial [Endozoicomonas sp. SESOKO2]|uniref:hypothetical protein n=1 Tax=Endozoicomonas sp. SESOKO2 TaxID=2828743 RepID=UPI002148B319